jgi:hypothetical protein
MLVGLNVQLADSEIEFTKLIGGDVLLSFHKFRLFVLAHSLLPSALIDGQTFSAVNPPL